MGLQLSAISHQCQIFYFFIIYYLLYFFIIFLFFIFIYLFQRPNFFTFFLYKHIYIYIKDIIMYSMHIYHNMHRATVRAMKFLYFAFCSKN